MTQNPTTSRGRTNAYLGRVPYRPGRTMRRFLKDRTGIMCLAVLLLLIFIAVLSRVWTPHDPNSQALLERLSGPSSEHWLGTDNLGRDLLSRLMTATWTALTSAALAVSIAVIGGVGLGLLSGFIQGPADWLLSRFNDVLLSLPPLLFAVAIIGALGPSLSNAMIAIGVLLLPRFYRLTRIATIESKREDFVEAARASGAGPIRIIVRHILPNIASPLIIQISFGVAVAIESEAGLSFLGLGAQPPTASWGSMTREGFDRLAESSWSIVPPSVILVIAILAVSLLGDAMRDASGRQQVGK